MVNINCIHNKSRIWCVNNNVKSNCCKIYNDINDKCEFQDEIPRPDPPSAPPLPPKY